MNQQLETLYLGGYAITEFWPEAVVVVPVTGFIDLTAKARDFSLTARERDLSLTARERDFSLTARARE